MANRLISKIGGLTCFKVTCSLFTRFLFEGLISFCCSFMNNFTSFNPCSQSFCSVCVEKNGCCVNLSPKKSNFKTLRRNGSNLKGRIGIKGRVKDLGRRKDDIVTSSRRLGEVLFQNVEAGGNNLNAGGKKNQKKSKNQRRTKHHK